jgi:hypothetical protein
MGFSIPLFFGYKKGWFVALVAQSRRIIQHFQVATAIDLYKCSTPLEIVKRNYFLPRHDSVVAVVRLQQHSIYANSVDIQLWMGSIAIPACRLDGPSLPLWNLHPTLHRYVHMSYSLQTSLPPKNLLLVLPHLPRTSISNHAGSNFTQIKSYSLFLSLTHTDSSIGSTTHIPLRQRIVDLPIRSFKFNGASLGSFLKKHRNSSIKLFAPTKTSFVIASRVLMHLKGGQYNGPY